LVAARELEAAGSVAASASEAGQRFVAGPELEVASRSVGGPTPDNAQRLVGASPLEGALRSVAAPTPEVGPAPVVGQRSGVGEAGPVPTLPSVGGLGAPIVGEVIVGEVAGPLLGAQRQAGSVVQREVAPESGNSGRPVSGLGRPLVRGAPTVDRPVVARFDFQSDPQSDPQSGTPADSQVEYVQREVEVQPPPFVPVESVQTATDEAAPAGQTAQTAQTAQGQEPEELLNKLYDPLVRRLKAELWLDRERRGALTDRWR
jgi:hypothetical protein